MEYDHGYKLYKKFYRNIHCNRAEFDEQNVDHHYNYGMVNAVFITYILARIIEKMQYMSESKTFLYDGLYQFAISLTWYNKII